MNNRYESNLEINQLLKNKIIYIDIHLQRSRNSISLNLINRFYNDTHRAKIKLDDSSEAKLFFLLFASLPVGTCSPDNTVVHL